VYVPAKFSTDEESAWKVVREAGAGTLVIATSAGLESVVVPVIVSDDRRTMRSHVARANPFWRSAVDGTEVLGLFLVASAYVSPSNYPSRVENPGVVPTWNYVSAEVRGRLRVRDDVTWLDEQVRALTHAFEEHRSPQWRVDEAPSEYVQRQLKAIVGLEIDVVSIQGKSKLSQNRPAADRAAVREHLIGGSLADRNVADRMNVDE
jgi:transcriptional regulator